jgi:hypothetical protein
MTEAAKDLKLFALDAEDLGVLSAHLQDAVVRVGDMAFLPRERRFVALVNRFHWPAALASSSPAYQRRRAALRFERVSAVQVHGIDLKAKRQVLSLLATQFAPHGPEDPAGVVTLVFAGDAAIRIEMECIEAVLEDLGAAWAAGRKPEHGLSEG